MAYSDILVSAVLKNLGIENDVDNELAVRDAIREAQRITTEDERLETELNAALDIAEDAEDLLGKLVDRLEKLTRSLKE